MGELGHDFSLPVELRFYLFGFVLVIIINKPNGLYGC